MKTSYLLFAHDNIKSCLHYLLHLILVQCVSTNKAIVSLLPPPASTQCGVGAVCVPIELHPVWSWCSVCPHRAIVSLFPPPTSSQCGVGAVCVPIELLSLPTSSSYLHSVELVQSVSP